MDPTTIIIIVLLLIGLAVAYWIGRKAGSFQKHREWELALPDYRKQAIMRSRAVLGGHFTENLAPYLPDFPYLPNECSFLGKPIDFIVFKGSDEKDIKEVVFVEVKSGKAKLSAHEKNLKEAIDKKKVRWEEYRIPEEITKKADIEEKIAHIVEDKMEEAKEEIEEVVEKEEKESYQERIEKIQSKHSKAYSKWTKKEEKKLLKMFDEGKPNKEIADVLNRQPTSILARLKKLGKIE